MNWRKIECACAALLAAAGIGSAARAAGDPVASPPVTAAPAGPATAAMPPLKAFAELPFFSAPALSPSGHKVAALLAMNGQQYFGIFDLAGARGSKPALVNLSEMSLEWFEWVNEDWLIVGVGGTTPVQGDTWYVTRPIAVSADAKVVRRITGSTDGQNGGTLIWVAQDGSPRVLLGIQHSVYSDTDDFWPSVEEIDVAANHRKTVVRSVQGVMNWYADSAGVVRMGISRQSGGRSRKLLYRDSASSGFRTRGTANSRKDESLTVPALFLDEPGKALVFADDTGFDALYELDLASLKVGKEVFSAPGYDLDGIMTDPTGSKLAGVRFTDEHSEVRWMDPKLAELQAAFDQSVGKRRARIVSLSRDQHRMMVHVGGADQAGGYYFFDDADGSLHLLSWLSNTFKGQTLSPVRTIRYKAHDGLDLSAVLTLPKDRPAKGLPLIVMPHGGPFSRDDESWDWQAQFLASRGYAVVQPNYRGSSGFGTAFAEKGEGQWGLAMQDDLNDTVDYLAKEGIADPARVCMVGGSYGGYAAMRAAERDGKRYRCAISFAGVSDLAAMKRYDSSFLDSDVATDWLVKQAPDLKAVSPINDVAGFSIPILLVHGKKDLRVPVAQSRNLAQKLKSAGKPVEYIEQPLADHHFSREADRLEFLTAVEAFLKKHNPA